MGCSTAALWGNKFDSTKLRCEGAADSIRFRAQCSSNHVNLPLSCSSADLQLILRHPMCCSVVVAFWRFGSWNVEPFSFPTLTCFRLYSQSRAMQNPLRCPLRVPPCVLRMAALENGFRILESLLLRSLQSRLPAVFWRFGTQVPCRWMVQVCRRFRREASGVHSSVAVKVLWHYHVDMVAFFGFQKL